MLSSESMHVLPMGESVRIPKETRTPKSDGPADAIERKDSARSGEEVPPAGQPETELDRVSEAVTHLKDRVQNIQRNLEFSVDENSGRTVIKVIDSETGEIIRQIPPEDIFAMLRNANTGSGMLVETSA